jgi:hypothetical protein
LHNGPIAHCKEQMLMLTQMTISRNVLDNRCSVISGYRLIKVWQIEDSGVGDSFAAFNTITNQ